MTTYRYEIEERPAELGGGWRLQLLADDTEIEARAFPADPDADLQAGIECFNSLTEAGRGLWLNEACSAKPVDAWALYLRRMAYVAAQAAGQEWLAAR